MISDTQRRRLRRLPAEWEAQQGVIVSMPDESMDWSYMLPEIHECYRRIVEALVTTGSNVTVLAQDVAKALEVLQDVGQRNIRYVEVPLNDTWVRDYGPLTVSELSRRSGRLRLAALDCGFNGWGLKFAADKDNLATLRLHEADRLFSLKYHNCRGYEIEGGSIESDGKGTILTTTRCLCSPNRNGGLSKDEVAVHLNALFGADHILWLDHGALEGDDTDSHIDTLARLCPEDTILYTGCSDTDDSHYVELAAMKDQLLRFRTLSGEQFNLIELPLPDAIHDEDDGHRLPATYCNYLVTDNAVLVPSYAQPRKDELARKLVKVAYPDCEVVSVDCRALIRQHGSLHCATMQIPAESVLKIRY